MRAVKLCTNQQNPPVLNWKRRLTQVDLCSGRKMVVVVVVVVYIARWLGSRVVSVLDSGAEGPRFKSQSRRCRVTVVGKLFTPIVPLFTKQQNW